MVTKIDFETLVAEARPRLLRYATHLCRNTEEAQDLVQMTLIKASRSFDGFDAERSTFLNWTLRILQRVFLDERRKQGRRISYASFEGIMENSDSDIDSFDVVDESVDLLGDIISAENQSALISVFDILPQDYAQALYMNVVEERNYEEIAQVQNSTVGTVRSRIFRAKKLLIEKGQEQLQAALR